MAMMNSELSGGVDDQGIEVMQDLNLDSVRNHRSLSIAVLVAIGACFLYPTGSHAQAVGRSDAAAATREQQLREQRVNALRQQQEQAADVLSRESRPVDLQTLAVDEAPCFQINQLALEGDDKSEFGWLLAAAAGPKQHDSPIGKCLGQKGINLILRRLQNALVEKAFITTRIAAKVQDLKGGVLTFVVTPGRIHAIRAGGASGAKVNLNAAMPSRPGDLLNLRDIEHGLENLKYAPTADADIEIVPAEAAGQSDVQVTYRQARPWRASVSLSDSGSKATGKYLGSATLSYDNLTGLSDLLYLTLNHKLGSYEGYGTRGGVLHYSVPFGYWSASLTYDTGGHHQTIAGAFENYDYSGRSANAELKLSRLVHRDASSKTVVSAGAFQRASSNFIDDTEVEVQRRRTGGWLATVSHRRYMGSITIDGLLGFKQGTGGFGALTAPEEAFGQGTSRYRITLLDATLAGGFAIQKQAMRYRVNLRAQSHQTTLAPPERFSIGGRYTVRGFDGESDLSGDSGWTLQHELATSFMKGQIEGYAGIDVGQVSGPSASQLTGKRLVGAVLGARASVARWRAEVFVGTPLSKPDGFVTANTSAGFNLSYSY